MHALKAAALNGHYVKACGPIQTMVPRQPFDRNARHLLTLSLVYRRESRVEVGPEFHLHEHQLLAVQGHEVDLTRSEPGVSVEHAHAGTLKTLGRRLLTGPGQA